MEEFSFSLASNLTDVLLCNIFSHLSPSSLTSLSSINLHWSQTVNNSWLWQQWFLTFYQTNNDFSSLLLDVDSISWQAIFRQRAEIYQWAKILFDKKSSNRRKSNIPVISIKNTQVSSPIAIPKLTLANSPPTALKCLSSSLPSLVYSVNGNTNDPPHCQSVSFSPFHSAPSSSSAVSLSAPIIFRLPTSANSPVSCIRSCENVDGDSSNLLVSYGRDLRLYSLTSNNNGKFLCQFPRLHSNTINACDLSSTMIVSGSRDRTLRWWNSETLECAAVSVKRNSHLDSITITRIVPGSSSSHILTGSLDGTIKIWDSRTSQCTKTLNENDRASNGLITSFDWLHPSNLTFITGSTSVDTGNNNEGRGKLSMWDGRIKFGVAASLNLPCGLITALSFSSNTRAVACGGSDSKIRIFDVRHFVENNYFDLSNQEYETTTENNNKIIPRVPGHIQSIYLDSNKLLTCQPNQFTIYAASLETPAKFKHLHAMNGNLIPYAHPVYAINKEYFQSMGTPNNNSSQTINNLNGSPVATSMTSSITSTTNEISTKSSSSLMCFDYDSINDRISLASSDMITVYENRSMIGTINFSEEESSSDEENTKINNPRTPASRRTPRSARSNTRSGTTREFRQTPQQSRTNQRRRKSQT